MFEILEEIYLRLIRNLYWNQRAGVRVSGEVIDMQNIKRGVRQGCVLSADLFNIYSEGKMRSIRDLEGIKVGGQNLNSIRNADDTALIADSKEKLQLIIERLVEASEQKGLKLNASKTKVIVISKANENV